jgi:hypothetical protein
MCVVGVMCLVVKYDHVWACDMGVVVRLMILW